MYSIVQLTFPLPVFSCFAITLGECDLVFLHAPNFGKELEGLDIHIRTTIRYDYSYIESAVVRIGEETFEVSSYGQYFLNGVSEGSLPGTIAGFPVRHEEKDKKTHIFEIDFGEHSMIHFQVFKDIVSIKVGSKDDGPYEPLMNEWFADSTGFLGSFDTTEWLARDGATVLTDPIAIGTEWQVLEREPMLFQSVRHPQYPEKCIFPSTTSTASRLLGEEQIPRESAEEACKNWAPDKREACIADVIALGDLEYAETAF